MPERHTSSLYEVLRYSVGSTLILGISSAYSFPLSFILPVLSLGFFAPGKSAPSFREGAVFVSVVAISAVIGTIIGSQAEKPIILLFIIAVLFINVFYTDSKWIGPQLKTWIIIAILLLPMMNLLYPDLAKDVAQSLVIGAILSVVMVWLVFGLFPSGLKKLEDTNGPSSAASKPSSEVRIKNAITSTLVILPLFAVFYSYKLSGSALILIFVGILAMDPDAPKNFKIGQALIIGNLAGGLISIIIFNLLTVVPNLTFLILIILATGMMLGNQFFKGKKTSALYNMAFSTVLLIIGSTTSSEGQEASEKVVIRVLQMAAAVTYVVVAFGVISNWKPKLKYSRQKLENDPNKT